MANDNQAMGIAFPLKFSGSATRTTNADMTALDFVRELKSRQTKFNWSDEAAMTQLKAALLDTAHTWYEDTFVPAHGTANPTRLTSLEAFLPYFRNRYNIEAPSSISELELVSPQKPGELLVDFAARIINQFTRQCKKVKQGAAVGLTNLPEDVRAAVTGVTDSFADFLDTRDNLTHKASMQMVIHDFAGQYITANMRDAGLRAEVMRVYDDTSNAADLLDKICTLARKLEQKPKANRQQNKQNNNNVHAVAEDDDSADDCNAVGKGNKGNKSKGKKKGAGTSSSSSFPPSSSSSKTKGQSKSKSEKPQCTYCCRYGHGEKDCFLKEMHHKEGRLAGGIASSKGEEKAGVSMVSHRPHLNW